MKKSQSQLDLGNKESLLILCADPPRRNDASYVELIRRSSQVRFTGNLGYGHHSVQA